MSPKLNFNLNTAMPKAVQRPQPLHYPDIIGRAAHCQLFQPIATLLERNPDHTRALLDAGRVLFGDEHYLFRRETYASKECICPDPQAAQQHRQAHAQAGSPGFVFYQERQGYWLVAFKVYAEEQRKQLGGWCRRLHSIISALAWGDDPATPISCHFACNNHACVSARHLRRGTCNDNREDRAQVQNNNRWTQATHQRLYPRNWAAGRHLLDQDGF